MKLIIRARRALAGAIYNKQLKLSPSTNKNFSQNEIGQYANHYSTFIVHMFFGVIINIVRCPAFALYAFYTLFCLTGINSIMALSLITFQMYFAHWINSKTAKKQHKLERVSEKRKKYMSETVYNSKTLKFYNWNDQFEKEISEWRTKEMNLMWSINIQGLGNHILSTFVPRIISPLVCASYFYFGGTLSLSESL